MKIFQIGCAMLLASGLASAQQYIINSVIGIPQVQGYFGDGGLATSAQLDKPGVVTVDSKGNVYFADYYTYVVRMVTASTGNIITISGNGVYGWVDGSEQGPVNSGTTYVGAGISELSYVKGLAVDSSGNVYIGDTANCRIRKVDTSYNTTTIAGTGTCSWTGDGAAATAATLWFPAGLAIDKSGNLYEAEYGSATVRKIDTTGKITTVAGTGTWGYSGDGGAASKAALASPETIAIDGTGNIFIGDPGNNDIREITTDGNIHTVISNVNATSLTVDSSGNLYFVDGVTALVWEVTSNGALITVAGTGVSGYGGDASQSTLAQLNNPGGVAAGPGGTLYISDTNNEVIRQLTPISFSVGAMTNAASNIQGAGVAPGEIVTIYGAGMGPSAITTGTYSNGALGSTVAGTQIYFGGTPAALIYTSAGLASAEVPFNVAGSSTTDVVVVVNGKVSPTTVVPVTTAAPGIFTVNQTGSGQAVAFNVSTGAQNTSSAPVKIGTYISLYITGAGPTSPAGLDGTLATQAAQLTLPVKATIGGVPATVSYAGAAPKLLAGVTQVNVLVPAGVTPGAAVPVTLTVGGIAAPSGVTIAVSN